MLVFVRHKTLVAALLSWLCASVPAVFAQSNSTAPPPSNQAVETVGGTFEDHMNAATDLFNKGKYEQAIAEFQKALALDPHNVVVHNWIGTSYQRLNLWDKATPEFESAVDLDPSYAEGQNNLAYTYQQLKQFEKAEQSYQKA